MRALPGGLVLLAVGRKLPVGIWWWRALVLGGLNIGAFNFLLFVAAYRVPGGIAAMVMSAQPMFVIILAAFFLSERIRPVHALACAMGIGEWRCSSSEARRRSTPPDSSPRSAERCAWPRASH